MLRGQDAVQITPGETVLVIGAGPIGAMHVLLAKLQGASKVLVSELIPERQAQVKALGADITINPDEEDLRKTIRDETDGIGVDVVVTAAPAHKAQETALEAAAIGGRINFFGGLPKDKPTINFNSNTVHYKELVVTGTTACSTDDCFRAARIVDSGRIDLGKMIGARFTLAEVQNAIESAEAGKALKVVIDP